MAPVIAHVMMTLRCSLIPMLSTGESRLRQASNAKPRNPKEAASQELWRDFLGEANVHRRVLHTSHGGNEELVELVATEHHARDVANGHPDAPLNTSVGRVPYEVSGNKLRVPQTPLGVDGGTVCDSRIVLKGGKHSLVTQRAAFEVVIVRPVLTLEGVGEVERLVVRTPARPIGANDAFLDLRHSQVAVEPPQPANLQLLLVVHSAGEEAASPVALAVVQPCPGLLGLDQLNELELSAYEIEKIEAVIERQDGSAVLAQCQRADVVLERPGIDLPCTRVPPPDRWIANPSPRSVDPVQRALVDVPYRTFTEVISALLHAFDPDGHAEQMLLGIAVCCICRSWLETLFFRAVMWLPPSSPQLSLCSLKTAPGDQSRSRTCPTCRLSEGWA